MSGFTNITEDNWKRPLDFCNYSSYARSTQARLTVFEYEVKFANWQIIECRYRIAPRKCHVKWRINKHSCPVHIDQDCASMTSVKCYGKYSTCSRIIHMIYHCYLLTTFYWIWWIICLISPLKSIYLWY